MKNYWILSFVVFLIHATYLHSQQQLTADHEITFGSHTHTNRDQLEFTIKNDEGNIYLIGTTERDETFKDIKVIKLTPDLKELWSKRISFNYPSSFDNVARAKIDSKGNIILFCMAAFNTKQSTLVLVKLSPTGETLWTLPMEDPENPLDYHLLEMNAFLDKEDYIHLIYHPDFFFTSKVHFITISSEGVILEDFAREDVFFNPDNQPDYYNNVLVYHDGFYYMMHMEHESGVLPADFYIKKFNKDYHEHMPLDLDNETASFALESFENSEWTIDQDGDPLWLLTGVEENKDFLALSFNQDGSNKVRYQFDTDLERYTMAYWMSPSGSIYVVSNNRIKQSGLPLSLHLQLFDKNGTLLQTFEDKTSIGLYAAVSDEGLIVYTDDHRLKKYDLQLTLMDNYAAPPLHTPYFNMNKVFLHGISSYYSGTSLDRNYHDSDYLSERDMFIRKFDPSDQISEFKFTGEGTSRALIIKGIKQEGDQYIVGITEENGPNNYNPGGSRPPRTHWLVYYDKELNLIKKEAVPDNLIEDQHPQQNFEYNYSRVMSPGDTLNYTISQDLKSVTFFHNRDQQWTKTFQLTYPNESMHNFAVDHQGHLLASSSDQDQKHRLHRIRSESDYEILDTDQVIDRLIPMTNGWTFAVTSPYEFTGDNYKVFSPELNEITRGRNESLNAIDAHFIEKDNQIIYWVYNSDMIIVFNQFGEEQERYFLPFEIGNGKHIYDGSRIVHIESYGYTLVPYAFLSWTRMKLRVIDKDISYLLESRSSHDDDHDGIVNGLDQCRNTQPGAKVNSVGCSSDQVLSVQDLDNVDSQLHIYPIPASNILYIDAGIGTIISSLEVFDLNGRLVKTMEEIESQKTEISVTNLTEGLYIVKIQLQEGAVYSKKFQVIKR